MKNLEKADFPVETKFVVREMDVPLTYTPAQGWYNWFGGNPFEYDSSRLTATNHDTVCFDEWKRIVEGSIRLK